VPESIHDKGYKRILSKKKNFLNLLKDFVKETWIAEVSEENLDLIENEFILKDFEEREADVIYRLRLNGQEVIFYCLLELQSSVDQTMPFRLLIYMTELWRRMFADTDKNERDKAGFKLPSIVPIVLYNGADSWTAVETFKEYLSLSDMFGNYVVDFQYILLNVNKYDDKSLEDVSTLISAVFSVDRKQNSSVELSNNLRIAGDIFKKLSNDEQIDFTDWLRDVLWKKVNPEIKGLIDEAIIKFEKKEVEDMTYAIERFIDKVEEEGIQKGIQRGIESGIERGRSEEIEKSQNRLLEVAGNLLKIGLNINQISESTGLSVSQIERIQNSSSFQA
jgi:predicted transposase/invertase (TIGR01784 family)